MHTSFERGRSLNAEENCSVFLSLASQHKGILTKSHASVNWLDGFVYTYTFLGGGCERDMGGTETRMGGWGGGLGGGGQAHPGLHVRLTKDGRGLIVTFTVYIYCVRFSLCDAAGTEVRNYSGLIVDSSVGGS